MQIAPLSFVPKQVSSPYKVMNHHDSLIFSITSEKYNSRKQTLLLDESKEMNRQKNEHLYNDYFTIQDKIKLLQEKVQNIKTNCYESENKQERYLDEQNQPSIGNLQFPSEIYGRKDFLKQQKSQIGKIKRKKEKPYFVIQQKIRSKSRSNTKNDDSIVTTKRNDLSAYNVNKFHLYKPKNSISRQKQTSDNQLKRQRSSSFTWQNKSTKFENTQNSQLRRLKKQLSQNKLNAQKISRKSKQSQRKLSFCRDQAKKLKNQNSYLQKSFNQIQQKLKRSEKMRQKQKEVIQQQKSEIQQLKGFLDQVLKRSNDETLRQSVQKDNSKGLKLKLLR